MLNLADEMGVMMTKIATEVTAMKEKEKKEDFDPTPIEIELNALKAQLHMVMVGKDSGKDPGFLHYKINKHMDDCAFEQI
jgi:hypothetical protein